MMLQFHFPCSAIGISSCIIFPVEIQLKGRDNKERERGQLDEKVFVKAKGADNQYIKLINNTEFSSNHLLNILPEI